MEIPYMILDEVKRLEQKDIEDNKVILCLTLNNITYQITLTPSFLQYRGFYFRIESRETFVTIMQNLLQNILEENRNSLSNEIEYNNYNPLQDPLFETLQIVLKSNKSSSMYWELRTDDDNILHNFIKTISFLYYLTPSYIAKKTLVKTACQNNLSS
jgi:hypothetical protein